MNITYDDIGITNGDIGITWELGGRPGARA
jgi:hypothetical protein